MITKKHECYSPNDTVRTKTHVSFTAPNSYGTDIYYFTVIILQLLNAFTAELKKMSLMKIGLKSQHFILYFNCKKIDEHKCLEKNNAQCSLLAWKVLQTGMFI